MRQDANNQRAQEHAAPRRDPNLKFERTSDGVTSLVIASTEPNLNMNVHVAKSKALQKFMGFGMASTLEESRRVDHVWYESGVGRKHKTAKYNW